MASSLPVPFIMKAKTTVSPRQTSVCFHRPELFHDPLPALYRPAAPTPQAAKQRLAFPSRVLGSEKGIGVRMVLRSTNK